MTKKQKIAIAIAVILLLLLLGLMFLMGRGQGPAVFINTGTGDTFVNAPTGSLLNTSTSINVSPTNDSPDPEPEPEPEPPKPDVRIGLLRLASSFSERFGSYSNISQFENIEDLKAFMTPTMATWADGFVEEQIEAGLSVIYIGITTRALNAEIEELDEDRGTARVMIKTQRRERSGEDLDGTVYYQDIILDFQKLGDTWKVNVATWQERP